MEEPLYLIDGSGYIFRAYYAIKPLSNSRGLPTNALLGFTRMLIKLIREHNVRRIAVAFDTSAPTFRHEMYSEYKANRAECPEDLVPQMPYFRRIVRALGIPCLERPGFEADDIIASLACSAAEKDEDVVIVSGDKDLTQLVNERIAVWDAMRDIRFSRDVVKEKFGVYPEQMRDFLALTGDSSDNVPGVRGIGPKTAQQLISHFGSLEAMLADTTGIEQIPGLRGAAGIRKKVEEAEQELSLSKELVSLNCALAPDLPEADDHNLRWETADFIEARELFDELEFSGIYESLAAAAGVDVDRASLPVKQEISSAAADREFVVLRAEELEAFARELARQPHFAFDTETTSLESHRCELAGISICWDPAKAYYLPFLAPEEDRNRLLKLEEVRRLLGPIFNNPEIKKIGLNLKFDINVLEAQGISVRGTAFDGMLASYVLNPDKRQHGLKALAKCHLNETMVTFEELLGDCEDLSEVPLDRVAHYACHDAHASFCLAECLYDALGEEESSPSPRYVFEQIEMPLVEVLAEMERTGIKLDLPFLKGLSEEFEVELRGLEQEIYKHAELEFNLNSLKQLSEVLFDKLLLPTEGVKRTQSSYSTDASVLQKLAQEFPIAELILDYRELFKLKSTYTDALQRMVRSENGRIHTSFNQSIAATGRLSSSDPNLQNIPIRNERGRAIRKAFIAEDGFKIVSADYSQIELRILAHLSGDKNLCRAFEENQDIHAATAREIFGMLSANELTKSRKACTSPCRARSTSSRSFAVSAALSGDSSRPDFNALPPLAKLLCLTP